MCRDRACPVCAAQHYTFLSLRQGMPCLYGIGATFMDLQDCNDLGRFVPVVYRAESSLNIFIMDDIFRKLNYKGQPVVHALQAPESFGPNIESLKDTASIKTTVDAHDKVSFIISFVTRQVEIDDITRQVAPKLEGDAVVWFCYPKGTSKKYKCDFNRDKGWDIMKEFNLRPVRMVAIDNDWSAMRFRKDEFVK